MAAKLERKVEAGLIPAAESKTLMMLDDVDLDSLEVDSDEENMDTLNLSSGVRTLRTHACSSVIHAIAGECVCLCVSVWLCVPVLVAGRVRVHVRVRVGVRVRVRACKCVVYLYLWGLAYCIGCCLSYFADATSLHAGSE